MDMIEDVIVEQLRNDGTIAGILSTYNGDPAVFSETAPEDVDRDGPYMVVVVRVFPAPDYVIDQFDIFVHYFQRGTSRAKAREVSFRVEAIFDPNTFQNDVYADIRFYRRHGDFLPEPDPLEIHYVKQLSARGSRKKWMQQLP